MNLVSMTSVCETDRRITRRLANPCRRWRMKGICEHRRGRNSVSAPSHEQRISGTARCAQDQFTSQWTTADELRSVPKRFSPPRKECEDAAWAPFPQSERSACSASFLRLTVSFPWGNRSAKWDIFRRLLWRFGQGKVKRVRVNGAFSVIRFFSSFSALALYVFLFYNKAVPIIIFKEMYR